MLNLITELLEIYNGYKILVGKGLLWYWPRVGDMEGSGGNLKSPAHSLHHILRLPPRISCGSWHRYRHSQGQAASAASGLEGGGPVRDLPGNHGGSRGRRRRP